MKLDKETLVELYCNQRLLVEEISSKIGCNQRTIIKHLDKYGIQKRSRTEWCKLAYERGRKRVSLKGSDNPNWVGGRTKIHHGYIRVYAPNHPRAKYNRMPEHILVWEQTHNQLLPEGWVVHHLNGIRTDNRPCNLVAMPRGEHIGLARPYKQRIRELEVENRLLQKALDDSQMIFTISDN